MDTLQEFLERGSLGPIALGLSSSAVRQVLGEPEDVGGKPAHRIWKYGALQIGFERERGTSGQAVRFIGLYFRNAGFALPDTIPLTGWFPDSMTNRDQLISYLKTQSIFYSEDPLLTSEAQCALRTASGVCIVFDSSPDGVLLDSIQLLCAPKVRKETLKLR